MGFIQSNHSVIMYNNTMISFNMLEVSRIEGVKRWVAVSYLLLEVWSLRLLGLTCSPSGRFFYASSACIYPEGKQLDVKVEGGGLKEQDAWPAQVCAAHHISAYPFSSTYSGC